MKNNIVVVFSSHFTEEENQKFIKHIDETIGVQHKTICYPNFNQFSLSQLYNDAIKTHREKDCIFVMCHNDIIIKTKNWGRLLLTKYNNSKYDIIGVAGSTYLPASGMWWEDRTKMCGIVEHTDGISQWVSEYSKPILNVKEVVLIDGLFITFNSDTIIHKFDEEFKGFHFYDLSFCVPNYLDGCNIGVTTVIRILHKSVGMTNQQWEDCRKQFAKKYEDELPLSLPPIYNDVVAKLTAEPKVAVVIPTKNNLKYILNNISSWNDICNYDNYEILIADTGSTDDVIAGYDEILSDKVKLIRYDWYNFAKINNDMVKNHVSADTELVLFCNDDIRLLNDALSRCVEIYNKNKDVVGTIGIRLHYGDGSIQHNGITIQRDVQNQIRLSHRDIRKTEEYQTTVNINSIGNTGAFLLIKKDLFQSLGGFPENYVECLEDVELNLRCKILGLKNITVSDAVAYHYESVSRNKTPGGENRFMTDYFALLNFIQNNGVSVVQNVVKILPVSKPVESKYSDALVNIITRTHNRPKYFKNCRESILNQSHKNINHVVGSDTDCDYYDNYIKLKLQDVQFPAAEYGSYQAPWNLHLNELQKHVKDGWVMYLDDDDKFVSNESLKMIMNNIENEDQMLLWRVDINGWIVPPNESFGKIVAGQISGIGFMFHSKHLPVDWGSWNFGDYRVMTQLAKKLKEKWINVVLTQTQGKPNFGQTPNNI